MNRFFRSALFPLIVIVLLVYLASQTFMGSGKTAEKLTSSELITTVQTQPKTIQSVTFDPAKQAADVTFQDGKKATVHYATPEAQIRLQTQIERSGIQFDSKGTGGFPGCPSSARSCRSCC